MLGPNCSQNSNRPEFIENWHIGYYKYADFDFNVKIIFMKHLLPVNPN